MSVQQPVLSKKRKAPELTPEGFHTAHSQADIRNPLRYLLITEYLLRSLSEGANTPPDTSKSPPTAYCFSQPPQGTYLIRLNCDHSTFSNISANVIEIFGKSFSVTTVSAL